jgi:hypothetical protein
VAFPNTALYSIFIIFLLESYFISKNKIDIIFEAQATLETKKLLRVFKNMTKIAQLSFVGIA